MLIAHVKAQIAAGYPMHTTVGQSLPRARMEIRQHWRAILREVAAKHGLTVDDLIGQRRTNAVSHPRQEAMYRMRMETPLSLSAIGARLGQRDHTTVLHGVKAHARRNGLALPL